MRLVEMSRVTQHDRKVAMRVAARGVDATKLVAMGAAVVVAGVVAVSVRVRGRVSVSMPTANRK
jgi:hypothetical protein